MKDIMNRSTPKSWKIVKYPDTITGFLIYNMHTHIKNYELNNIST